MSSSAASGSHDLLRQIASLRRVAVGSMIVSVLAILCAIVAVTTMVHAPASTVVAPAVAAVPSKLDELTVGRLNVVEPDGRLRMIISSRTRFPGAFSRGKEIARPDRRDLAGILFVDDEGNENGGLVQKGLTDKAGKIDAALSMTFDRYRQDQMVQLALDDSDDSTTAGLYIRDQPNHKQFSVDDLMKFVADVEHMPAAEREAAARAHDAHGDFGHRRGFFGARDGTAQLVLDDPQGRPRLVLRVSPQGEPAIELLDEAGRVVRTVDARSP